MKTRLWLTFATEQTIAIMSEQVFVMPATELARLGLKSFDKIHYQSSPDELIQDTLRMGEGMLNDTGALMIRTGEFTGRAPKDKFIVKDESTENTIHWNDFNVPIDAKYFDIVYKKIIDYHNRLPEIWVRDCYACADPRYQMKNRGAICLLIICS